MKACCICYYNLHSVPSIERKEINFFWLKTVVPKHQQMSPSTRSTITARLGGAFYNNILDIIAMPLSNFQISQKLRDGFFRTEIRPEKSHRTRASFVSTETCQNSKILTLAFFSADKAYPGSMDFFQALFPL